MTRHLTAKEVQAIYGISPRALDLWVADGCPVLRRRGREGSRFNPAKVAVWVEAKGKTPRGIEGGAIKGSDAAVEAPKSPRPTLDPPGQLEAVRKQYAVLYNRFVQAVNSRSNNLEISSLSRALAIKGPELRQLEMAVLEWQAKTGELCNYAEMERAFVELASGTRERVMAVPNQVAPTLRQYLRDPEDAGAVRDIIDAAVRHALTALPATLPERGTP